MSGQREGFYTMKGYQINENADLTASMEDYLEMICRILQGNPSARVRVRDLADNLHVRPSSVTKMIQHLTASNYLSTEKYGYIRLTQKGLETGRYLLYRHEVICRFLCLLNKSQDELEQAEKIEHFLNRETVHNLDLLAEKLSGEN